MAHAHHDKKPHKNEHETKPDSKEQLHEEASSHNQCCRGAKETSHHAKSGTTETKCETSELEQLKKELAETKDKYLRSLAEAENSRKRLQKEKQEMIQYAQQNIIVDFLNPIDHMENALKFADQMSEDVKHWAIGFQMILTQFKDVLNSNGVKAFVSEGQTFDPHRHEAVENVITDDFPAGTVVEESLRGYTMGDKTIRPARVKVAKSTAAEMTTNETKNEQ